MAEHIPETSKTNARPRGLLDALGLSPKELLLVSLLALLVWWYFQKKGMALTTTETAVVVLGFALAVFACRAIWAVLRRVRIQVPGKTAGKPK